MLEQMYIQCNAHNLLLDYQSACRENRSCETVLLNLTNDLLWSMERMNVTALIALDSSATFDTVDHSVLLTTLDSNFGINGIALEWLKNYLAPRGMKIKIRKSYSEKKSSLS